MREKAILLVDDNPDDVALTLRALKKNHILNKVIVARDGSEALDFLFGTKDSPPIDMPALILLDINMPRISGLEVLERIRANERTRLQPVVMLTTSDEDRDLIDSYRLGANSYISKPVEFDEFNKVIKQLGIYWLAVNTGPHGE